MLFRSDASNVLKPALSRGEIQCIGATTLDEYRKHIEKDAALERRFQPVLTGEPSVTDTISILRGLKEKYEIHHKVRVTDAAIVAAATLSERYITDRFLPDKAIDLVDEAASRLRIEIDSLPEAIDEVERRRTQLEIERQALRKESDPASKERLAGIDKEVAELNADVASKKAQWQAEKEAIAAIHASKERQDELRHEAKAAERGGDLERAAELTYGELVSLGKELERQQARLGEIQKHGRMLKEEVEADDVANVVARWTGIPVNRMLEGEMEKLLEMEARLAARVVGQDEALRAVADAVRRSRAGLADPNRPTGSFLFLGPTGVGKTETARALAEFLFDDEQAMVRIDMSEYMEKHAVSRLIGAPPGYVGFEEGGQLTETVRRRPYCVVLLDEIEKAHPDVFNVLLQVLDDGRLTDGQGRTVDFKNAVVIMTSNIGSDRILAAHGDAARIETEVMELLRQAFKPEFLNRVDDVVLFHNLSREHLRSIACIQLDRVAALLAPRDVELEVSDAARDWLAEVGYDPDYGARPLKRAVEKRLKDPLAKHLIAGQYSGKVTVHVDRGDDGGLGFRFEERGDD